MSRITEFEKQIITTTDIEGNVIEEEIIEKQKSKITKKEPLFVKMYLDDIDKFSGLSEKESSIMLNLIKIANFESNEVYLNAGIKQDLGKHLGVTMNYIDKTLTKLCKKKLFTRRATGTYKLNPFIFGYGSWDKISELRMTIIYNSNGRSFNLEEVMNAELPLGKKK